MWYLAAGVGSMVPPELMTSSLIELLQGKIFGFLGLFFHSSFRSGKWGSACQGLWLYSECRFAVEDVCGIRLVPLTLRKRKENFFPHEIMQLYVSIMHYYSHEVQFFMHVAFLQFCWGILTCCSRKYLWYGEVQSCAYFKSSLRVWCWLTITKGFLEHQCWWFCSRIIKAFM